MSSAEPRRAQLEALVEVLARHSGPGARPEDLLVDYGLVPDREVAIEVALHTGLPFRGLRGYRPDPALFTYLPFAEAIEKRICPLSLDGDTLTVASAWADPDLSSVKDRFPNLEFELMIAPREEIIDALTQAGVT